ncbi:Nucleolar protein 56 [Astathelohania contejeani]|uniref:Nucleolar protein 56 n=1 Tax=Astathelohania contejeani TaxID=164912 RepID=A0ABQ7I0J0_9MICR|nr:Nucleolar protein 56 [Thelohania contejeani]
MEFLLFEHPTGYALFKVKEPENFGTQDASVEFLDYIKLKQLISLHSFYKFESSHIAMEHLSMLAKGEIHEQLKAFLELNGVKVLHCDKSLGSALSALGIKSKASPEISRGIRANQTKLIKTTPNEERQAYLGLAHTYSRSKVEYNIGREDNLVVQSVALLDQLDRDINTYMMRLKEIYGWHFPELSKIISDPYNYVQAVHILGNSEKISIEEQNKLKDLFDEETLKRLEVALRNTVGVSIPEEDLKNINRINLLVKNKIEMRKNLAEYLKKKLNVVAPNLSTLLGDHLAARFISQAGGLLNLSKAPSSTLQVLGAEKALFRSLKSKTNTPKYGLIYNALGCADMKNRGRLARFIASKCSIASRIDCFKEERTNLYGMELKKLINQKLESFKTNKDVERTDDVLKRVFDQLKALESEDFEKEKKDVKNKKEKEKKKLKENKEIKENVKEEEDKKEKEYIGIIISDKEGSNAKEGKKKQEKEKKKKKELKENVKEEENKEKEIIDNIMGNKKEKKKEVDEKHAIETNLSDNKNKRKSSNEPEEMKKKSKSAKKKKGIQNNIENGNSVEEMEIKKMVEAEYKKEDTSKLLESDIAEKSTPKQQSFKKEEKNILKKKRESVVDNKEKSIKKPRKSIKKED